MERNKYKQQIFSGEITSSSLFETDQDLIDMRLMLNLKFLKKFEEGL